MFQGSLVALITPMLENGAVDYPALSNLLDFHLDQGTHGVVTVGTTGESATLNFDEHCAVIEYTVKHIASRIPVIAGTGANSTAEAVELTHAAQQLKADACLLVTPYYNKPTQQGLYLHYRTIAEQVAIPQILYNVPGRTACDLLTDTIDRLADIDNIIAVKDATGDLERGKELIDRCGDRLAIFSGDDASALDHILLGGSGDISVTANIAPRVMSELCDQALAGNSDRARTLNDQISALHQVLFVESNPIPVKWALSEMGLCGETLRLPMTPLTAENQTILRTALQEAGILET